MREVEPRGRYFPIRYYPQENEKKIPRRGFLFWAVLAGIGGVAWLWERGRRVSSPAQKEGGGTLPKPAETPLPPKLNPEDILPTQIQNPVEVQEENEVTSIAWMPETVKYWSKDIVEISERYNVDPKLTAVVILCESGGHPFAVSPSAALGLCQVLETTAAPGVNLFDAQKNIAAGAGYLAEMFKLFGNWDEAITAYNAGPGNVLRGTIPAGGIQYRYWVTGMWGEIGQEESSVYKEWLAADGWVLVDRAEKFFRLDPRVRQAVEFAMRQWHKGYLLGGEGPESWDCARLVYFAYKDAGVDFNGTIAGGKVVADQWSYCGRFLAADEEKLAGDLIVFVDSKGRHDHVGMMIYPPYYFIEASGLVMRVKVTSLDPRSKIYREDLAERVAGFKRIIG